VGRYPINGYLLADRSTGVGAFVDPGGWRDEIGAFIESQGVELRHILFTHGHWDHTEGLVEFGRRYAVQCWAGVDEVRAASRVLHGGETIEIGRQVVRVFSTPGHTAGGVSYWAGDRVFTGDALFCGSVGGTDSAEAARGQVEAVRAHIFSLPDDTLVLPGHGPMSTVAAERYGNPFFRKGF
jgi:glyoxylase-like metal-dependent hydrolase (beta-lactamase superfamily II)